LALILLRPLPAGFAAENSRGEDLVWRANDQDWRPLRDCEEFQTLFAMTIPPPLPTFAAGSSREDALVRGLKHFFGWPWKFHRRSYLAMIVVANLATGLLGTVLNRASTDPGLTLLALLGVTAATYGRARNIGISGWWGLLALVPGLNLLVVALGLIIPEGFAGNRRLDVVAKIGLAILAVFAGLWFFISPAIRGEAQTPRELWRYWTGHPLSTQSQAAPMPLPVAASSPPNLEEMVKENGPYTINALQNLPDSAFTHGISASATPDPAQ